MRQDQAARLLAVCLSYWRMLKYRSAARMLSMLWLQRTFMSCEASGWMSPPSRRVTCGRATRVGMQRRELHTSPRLEIRSGGREQDQSCNKQLPSAWGGFVTATQPAMPASWPAPQYTAQTSPGRPPQLPRLRDEASCAGARVEAHAAPHQRPQLGCQLSESWHVDLPAGRRVEQGQRGVRQ